jgi:Leucine Rich repeats (2 copies)
MMSDEVFAFSSTHPIQVLTRPVGGDAQSWTELDLGPGYFRIEPDREVGVRIRNCDDAKLERIVAEIASCPVITFINLAENRKVTDKGIENLTVLKNLKELNLSSCDITNDIFPILVHFPKLESLNLSYCPRISDAGLKPLRELKKLVFLDLQGCSRISRGGLVKIERPGLKIHKHK